MDNRLESALNAAALRPANPAQAAQVTEYQSLVAASHEQGTVAEAFQAQDVLRAMTEWHQRNEDADLPTALLCMLYAARRVC
jgi:hypothetical protein